jgi:predicted transcriptional regulator
MKSVLISIQPKWCELIASGKKTVDVRKTRPKLEPPFKVYIYCTKDNTFAEKTLRGFSDDGKAIYYKANKGKVIGEFVCDDITRILNFITRFGVEGRSEGELNTIAQCSCLDYMDMLEYFGADKDGYAWHISDLVIYDQPRSLTGFYHYCGDDPKCDGCEFLWYSNTECGKEEFCCSNMYGCKTLKRPPQSWCYVVEGGE